MAAGKSSRINRQYKMKYRIRNWREYERGLRSCGDVTIWLSEDAIAAWIPPKNGLRGGQRRYSNLAIRTALTLRVVFGLPLRQTEGFLDSLLSLMSRDLKAPDHTTLSRHNDLVPAEPLLHCQDRRSRPTSSNAGDLTGTFCTRWKERESEAALAHVVWDKVEAAYARSDLFARRHQLMDEWAAYVNGGTRASHVAPSVICGDLPTHAQRRGGDRQGGGSAPSHTERGRPAS